MRTSPSALTVSGNTECGTSDADDRRHAVRLEQPADDAGFDVGVRAEDDDQVGAHRCSASAPARTASPTRQAVVDLQENHRHVVVLRRAADKRLDLAQDALAQLVR